MDTVLLLFSAPVSSIISDSLFKALVVASTATDVPCTAKTSVIGGVSDGLSVAVAVGTAVSDATMTTACISVFVA